MTSGRDSIREDRVQAVAGFGLTDRQARFLVNVMVYAGVFLERQYCAFAGIAHGQKTHDFLAKLVQRGYVTVITPGRLHRGRLFHVQYKPLYEAIREPNNRHRKPASLGRMVERLMLLDAVLADKHYSWLGTEHDKVAYFMNGQLNADFPKQDLPHITFGEGDQKTVRYFPDKLPIGVERDYGPRHVFLYLVTREVPADFRVFLFRHAELLKSVQQWTIRLLVPRRFHKAMALYRYAVRDELATPLSPYTVDTLEWLFRQRQGTADAAKRPDDVDLARAMRKAGASRFRSLYRLWQRDPHHTLWYATSFILRDQLQRGDGRIEFVNLTRQYLQLSPLIGVA
jgi:hypothetical protein